MLPWWGWLLLGWAAGCVVVTLVATRYAKAFGPLERAQRQRWYSQELRREWRQATRESARPTSSP